MHTHTITSHEPSTTLTHTPGHMPSSSYRKPVSIVAYILIVLGTGLVTVSFGQGMVFFTLFGGFWVYLFDRLIRTQMASTPAQLTHHTPSYLASPDQHELQHELTHQSPQDLVSRERTGMDGEV